MKLDEMQGGKRIARVDVTLNDGEVVTCDREHIASVAVDDWTSPNGDEFKSVLVLRLIRPKAEGDK